MEWAIPFPLPTDDEQPQGTWVWFDALPNYLTATGYPAAGWKGKWPAQLHVVGKDITRLHVVVWPAMLQAAELPFRGMQFFVEHADRRRTRPLCSAQPADQVA